MKPPAIFECPSCSKKHYLVYCVAGGEQSSCERAYLSVFYPSPRDSICPTHRYPDDPEKAEIEWEKVLRCPTTSETVSIENLFKAKAKAKKLDAQAEMVLPDVAFVPQDAGEGKEKEELPATGLARCPTCKVLFDLVQTRVCPRCGKAPAAKALVEETKKKEAESERRREKLYDVAIRQREKIFALFSLVAILCLIPLGLTQSSGLTVSLVVVILLMLGGGIGLEFVFLRIVDVPYYRVQWEEEMKRRKGKRWWEARQILLAKIMRRTVDGGAADLDALAEGDDEGEDFRWLWGEGPEPGGAGKAQQPADVPARAVVEPQADEIPHLEDLLPELQDAAPEAVSEESATADEEVDETPAPLESERIQWPEKPTTVRRVRYLGGHPEVRSKARGALVVSADGLSFVSSRGQLLLTQREVTGVRSGLGTSVIAWALAILLSVFLLALVPTMGAVQSLPDSRGFEAVKSVLRTGEIAVRAAQGLAIVIAAFLLSGACFGLHHRLRVRFRLARSEAEKEGVVAFALPLLASLHLRRALGS